MGVHWSVQAARDLAVDADIIDLRSLVPIDWDTVFRSVRKTGKVLVVHEDTLTGGIGAELAARINEELFDHLDAPVMRCASLDTPVPFAASLEKNFLANSRLLNSLEELASY
jgi:2-oxoisovalerate dehydrogenase E1 component